ncbi:TorF family putative porin [Paraferrimonas sp. SM1919]|uniref:TorF family putative porin n=1 Tax=Paraferrimonas sp. SM1919 TaxID=2662263 RepID=UPI0013D80815|nr:TorF family putative porin [Paraferrimonas sp. SM1919]
MKTKLLATAGLLVAAQATAIAAEVSGNVALTSDYRWRGQSLSAGNPAIQAGVDVNFDSGWFVGAWASNLDYGQDTSGDMELDLYAGYWGEIDDNNSYSATLISYQYPGSSDIDSYEELILGFSSYGVDLEYYVTNNAGNTGMTSHYVSANYSHELMDNLNLDLHAGHNFGEYWDSGYDYLSYVDTSIGLSTSHFGLDFSAAYLVNFMDNQEEVVDSGAFKNSNGLLFTVSKSF